MATKSDLGIWVLEALSESKGSASILTVCEFVWRKYKEDLENSGNLF